MPITVRDIPDSLIQYLQAKLLQWGPDNFSDFPWRYERNLFHALVAEVLLQRTRAEQVVAVYNRFKERFPDPASLAEAAISEIEITILPLGLKWRARFLSALGKRLSEMNGKIPLDVPSLLAVPGVGPYAAAAFLSLHAGTRVPIVDSNIIRFYGRFFGFDTGPESRRDREVIRLGERITPNEAFKDFNYALIDFSRKICRSKPHHDACPVAEGCQLYHRFTASLSIESEVEK